MLGDFGFEDVTGGGFGRKNHIAAGDEGFDIGKAQFFKQLFQPAHGRTAFAQVDAAEKGDVAWHGVYLSALARMVWKCGGCSSAATMLISIFLRPAASSQR